MGCTPVKQTKTSNARRRERKLSSATLDMISDFRSTCRQYVYKRTLGRGRYGHVFLAESSKAHQQVAIKALPKSSPNLIQEIDFLSQLDHPNIVKYHRHYESGEYVYLVMEYCEGEELFNAILRKTKLSEEEALGVMEKSLRAVSHCHEMGIIHCDLKPENLMVGEGTVKVIDFGLAMSAGSGKCRGIAGTPYYIAPEIVKEGLYTTSADIWSLGIIMHTMLTGYVPVGGKDNDEILQKIKEYEGPVFDSNKWKRISPEAKDLLEKMLNPKHASRITAVEALNHPWFARRATGTSLCNVSVLDALQRYSEFPEVKKNILNVVVRSVADAELKEFQKAFLELDKAKTGVITAQDLEAALSATQSKVSRKELEELTKKVNQRGRDCISYSDFVGALIATRDFLTEERLSSVFKIVEQEEPQQRALTTVDSF